MKLLIFILLFVMLTGAHAKAQSNFKKIIIYAVPLQHALREEITRGSIKDRAWYILSSSRPQLSNEVNVLEIYNEAIECQSSKEQHLNEGIRYLVILKFKRAKNLRIYIDKFGKYEVNFNGCICEMKLSHLRAIQSLIP